jgi:hypothetical protein
VTVDAEQVMRHQIGEHRLDDNLERRRQCHVPARTGAFLEHPHAVQGQAERKQGSGYRRCPDQFERLHQRPRRNPADQRDDQAGRTREHDRVLERSGHRVDQ